MEYEKLAKKVKENIEAPDLSLIKKAYDFAQKAHQDQKRSSGVPFVEHPLGTAEILSDLGLDVISITAAILHDVVEDTDIDIEEIKKEFGEEVAVIVDGVTKLTRLKVKSREEYQAESLRKMFLAMAEDIRVVLIKLADRLHNMRTLNYLGEEKQKQKAQETLDIYGPLAHRLGMSRIKWELEDLSFRYLQPEVYREMARKVNANRQEREDDIENAIELLKQELAENDIEADIYGRPKHLYSIYQKMQRKGVNFDEIYDLTAIRVIVDSVRQCYEVLGIVHEIWKPMPGRFKDYIAMPKSNMYQSLHTTVIGAKGGDPLEVQIRTPEMHRTAEYGIAAHWRYKEGKAVDEDFEDKLAWLRQLLEWQKDLQEPAEFMENLKVDLFEDEVFVFTPKGDVVSLPRGSTPVDFAYNIHTEVGHNCRSAKVNGKMVPLEYELENGDIVEILTSKSSGGPSRDWLEFVQSSRSRSKIKRWFKKQQQEEIIQRGKKRFKEEMKKRNLKLKEKNDKLSEIARDLGKNNPEEIYEEIGYNNLSAQQVVNKLDDRPQQQEDVSLEDLQQTTPSSRSSDKGVQVQGVNNLKVRIANCCNPLPGDEIVGFITRGRGVSVHREDCPNIANLREKDEERFIEVAWGEDKADTYTVDITITAVNKQALLNEITLLIKEEQLDILSVVARTDKYNKAFIDLTIEISSLQHMRDLMTKINSISGVLSVDRSKPN